MQIIVSFNRNLLSNYYIPGTVLSLSFTKMKNTAKKKKTFPYTIYIVVKNKKQGTKIMTYCDMFSEWCESIMEDKKFLSQQIN